MASRKGPSTSLFDAAKAIYDTLSPLDAEERKRVLSSALSLLGMESPLPSATGNTIPASTESSATAATTGGPGRPLSPVELVQQKHPSTNAQRIAVFAYFREKYEGASRFARTDLKPYFAKAKVPAPQNFDRDFNGAVSIGYIYEDGSESYLTSKGLEAVEAGFDGREPARSSASRAKPKKPRAAKHK